MNAMWIQLGLAGGAVVVVVAVLRRVFRRRTQKIDVGPVSESWLAEQRARSRESH
jgi:hypothetical protein